MPITTDFLHALPFVEVTPRFKAVKVDEQAVSILKQGPMSPRVYESRPDVIEAVLPLAENTLVTFDTSRPLGSTPTKTPVSEYARRL